MSSVDNFEKFKELIDFSHPNSFYFLQIIQRSKDDNSVTASNNRYRRIKSYYIASLEEYNRIIPEIKKLCKDNNARAYIRVSPISFYDVAINTAIEYMRRIKECQTFKSNSIYDSCCETTKTCSNKVWIIDYDKPYNEWILAVLKEMGIEVLYYLPTKNGVHFIIKPFDKRKWSSELERTIGEIKNNNPITLLYYYDLSS